MDSDDLSFLPLKVIHVGANGKRTYDPEGKRRLIGIARARPRKISISRLALKAGVNANQLRKWIRGTDAAKVVAVTSPEVPMPAFVPAVAIDAPVPQVAVREALAAHREVMPPPAQPRARLSARLPNGVVIDLECAAQDTVLVKAMIVALGVR